MSKFSAMAEQYKNGGGIAQRGAQVFGEPQQTPTTAPKAAPARKPGFNPL